MSKLSKAEADRRDFLKTAGKFAVIVPPTMTFLLSTTMSSPAIAASTSDNHCNSGQGNGDEGCDPGNSGDHNHGGDETTTNPGNGNPHG